MGAAPGVTPTMHLILLCLLRGERHGHAVMQEVEALTEGQVRLGPGTLYGSIKKMLATGLIEEVSELTRRPLENAGVTTSAAR